MCWSQKSQGMMTICVLLILLIELAVLYEFLPSHRGLHRFCSRDSDTIRGTYNKWRWRPGHPKDSNYRSVRIIYSFLLTFSIWPTFVRIYQGWLILIIPMHNVYQPCAYDLDWYDDCGDDADELDGGPREHTTREILFLVGIWVSLFLILIFPLFFCWQSYPRWLSVPRRRSGESGTRNGVRYRRKVISGGRGVGMQSGWMLWVFRGWDGFVSDHFILFFWLPFLLVFVIFWFHDIVPSRTAEAPTSPLQILGSIFISMIRRSA